MAGKRAEKRRNMEQAVLEEATEMLRAGGPDALTIAALAQRLGVSVGGLYRYYPSKGAILVGLEKRSVASFRAVQDDLLEALEARLARRPPEVAALARIMGAASAYEEHAHRDPVQHRIMTQFLAVPDILLDEREVLEVEAELRPLLVRSAGLIAAAAEVGALAAGDAVQRTFVLWAALQGADQFWKRDRVLPPELRSNVLAALAADALLAGWGAPAAELAAARRLCPAPAQSRASG
jgi:AcrR family transcriptional regulator